MVCIGIFYSLRYPIQNNNNDIQRYLVEWESRDSDKASPNLLKVKQLGNSSTYIAFYEIHSNPAIAIMEESFYGKLRIVSSYSGTSKANYREVKTEEGYYGIVTGKNQEGKIDTVLVSDQEGSLGFKKKVPAANYFILIKKLSRETKIETTVNISFYDKMNKQIPPSD